MKSNDFLILNIESIAAGCANREIAMREGKKFELRAWNPEGTHSRLLRRFKTRSAAELAAAKMMNHG